MEQNIVNEIKEYSKKIGFQDLDLIKKLILKKEERKRAKKEAIPKVRCPKCHSDVIEIEYSDDEYSDYHWLSCECGEEFEDDFGYFEATENLGLESYFDEIEVYLDFKESKVKFDENWEKYCRKEIIKMLETDIC